MRAARDASGSSGALLQVQYPGSEGESSLQLGAAPEVADVIVASRPAFPGGYFALRNWSGVDQAPSEHVIGLSAFVAVTSPDLQIEAISIEDIAAVFAGDIRNWSDLGGPDPPITPFIREQSSNARNDFEQMVMAPSGKTISQSVIAGLSDATVAAAQAQASVQCGGPLHCRVRRRPVGHRAARLQRCGRVSDHLQRLRRRDRAEPGAYRDGNFTSNSVS